jgi:thioredoxin-like negative regulator of GroEL
MSNIIDIDNKEHFEKTVIETDIPAIVEFWSPGCSSCQYVEGAFLDAANEFTGNVRFVRVNTHTNEEVARIMRIRHVPTLVVFRGPSVFDIRVGRSTKKSILRMAQRVHDKENGAGFVERLKSFFRHF